ncbi:hypothetical protein YC2023_030333 [Brassica napus]
MALVTSQILTIFWVKSVKGDWSLGNPPSQTEASRPASTIASSASLGFPFIAIMAVWTSASTIVLYLRLHSSNTRLKHRFSFVRHVDLPDNLCPKRLQHSTPESEKVNGEVEALKEKTKHAKSKFKATDSDGGSRTIGSYSSSSEDSAPQQKEDVEVKKTLRELLEPARMHQLEVQRRRTLHLSNLSYDVTEDDIMNFFSGIGGSMDVRIPLGQDGKCRGFAFVEFDYPRSSEEGLKLHLKPMLKRSVRISIAHPRAAGVGRGRGAPGVGRGHGVPGVGHGRGAPGVGRGRGGR